MKVIITSGPMQMEIDKVRKIENSSTGKLGTLFAQKFNELKYNVTYIHTAKALCPQAENIKKILIATPKELLEVLKSEIIQDCVVIHLMAINDFQYQGSININQLFEEILVNKNKITKKADLQTIFNKIIKKEDKLTSQEEQLLYLTQEIKIIDQIKKINKSVRLVGFKLLANITDEELLEVGKNLKQRADCEIVVANKKETITNKEHQAFLITNLAITKVMTKEEIVKEVIKVLKIAKD
ncbi:MAG: phosphopantothenoylcysteine decarboxylase [Mycoplasmatales bacterium]